MTPVLVAAAFLSAAAAADPTAVLATARKKVLENIRRVPNYTCVQTVNRSYFEPAAGRGPRGCEEIALRKSDGSFKLRLSHTDRLRLEVAVAPEREMYSWVGARDFENGEIDQIVRFGPIGTGSFTSYLANIFGNRVTLMTYSADVSSDDRKLMEFSYAISKEQSRYRVRARDEWIFTGFDGTVRVDPRTGDLTQLTIRTSELPQETNTCESSSTLEYTNVNIGNSTFLLPREARQRFVARNATEAINVTTFSACREYRGESVVRFDVDPETAAAAIAKREAASLLLSPGIEVSIEWTSPIDSATAAAGDALAARLAKPLRDRRSKVVVPAGARIEGRIMRIQVTHLKPESVTIVRRVETIEIDGTRVPLHARFNRNAEQFLRQARGGFRSRGAVLTPTPYEHEANYELLNIPGTQVAIREGARSDWVTTK